MHRFKSFIMSHQDNALRYRQKGGFSLVELSIVLVILGLLVGGIMTGQNLIKAAELRSVTKEYEQWQTAVNLFQDKYMALPGEMTNATAFWGRADGVAGSGQCADPNGDAGTGTQTCNGNGDGEVDEDWEELRFWQHLSNAGLIEGNYTGVPGVNHNQIGESVPKSKYGNGGWGVDEDGTKTGSGSWLDGTYGHTLIIGTQAIGATNHEMDDDLFTAEEVWNIDTKMDDGKPGQGRIRVWDWDDCSTATLSSETDADYELSHTEVDCALIFTNVF